MISHGVQFSIAQHAQWAPGLETDSLWDEWAAERTLISPTNNTPPGVQDMPAMLRRRARFLGRMALEVAYRCLGERQDIPTIFCSRHGEVDHSVELIQELNTEGGISPIGFSSAVHNATAGLFSIARKDRSNHIAIAAGASTVEHAVIEACSLLEDGAQAVLLVNYEQALPAVFERFQDCLEQAYAWAWLIVPAREDSVTLQWKKGASISADTPCDVSGVSPPGLDILHFHLAKSASLERSANGLQWTWSRNSDAV